MDHTDLARYARAMRAPDASRPVFLFYSDPGHGWLCVPASVVRRLGVKPSRYSYAKAGIVYLEEDCDAPAFIKAWRDRHGSDPDIAQITTNHDSFIRSLDHYSEGVPQ